MEFLAAVGGGSAAAGSLIAGSAATTLFLGIQQSQIIKSQGEQAVEDARVQARDREVARKRNLVATVARQNAMIGVRGTRGEGSTQNLQLADIEQSRLDQALDVGRTQTEINRIVADTSNARRFAALSAAADFGTTIGRGLRRS